MCWFCDHPGGMRSDYIDQLRRTVARSGWAVQGIQREGFHPPWAYTVGLTAFGQPELVATGMANRRAVQLLNEVGEHLLHAPGVKLGEPIELTDGPVIQILEVADAAAHLEMAVELFGPGIRALQVVHADNHGRWPWECGYRGVPGGQPLLSPPTLPTAASPAASPAGNSRRPVEQQQQAAGSRPRRGPGKRRRSRSARRHATRSVSRPPSRTRVT